MSFEYLSLELITEIVRGKRLNIKYILKTVPAINYKEDYYRVYALQANIFEVTEWLLL